MVPLEDKQPCGCVLEDDSQFQYPILFAYADILAELLANPLQMIVSKRMLSCYPLSRTTCPEPQTEVLTSQCGPVSFLLRICSSIRLFGFGCPYCQNSIVVSSCYNPPFACFSRIIAAWASFVRANSVPVWLFLAFCSRARVSLTIAHSAIIQYTARINQAGTSRVRSCKRTDPAASFRFFSRALSL